MIKNILKWELFHVNYSKPIFNLLYKVTNWHLKKDLNQAMESSELDIRIAIEMENNNGNIKQSKPKSKNRNMIYAIIGSLLIFLILIGVGIAIVLPNALKYGI